MSSPLEEFKFARWANCLNRAVQIVLSLSLVAGLNYLAARHFARFDLTANRRYTLSAETRSYLGEIPRGPDQPPVEIILTMPAVQPDDEKTQQVKAILEEMRALMREYDYAGRDAPGGAVPLKTEEVDIFRDSVRTEELKEKFGLNTDSVLVVARGDRGRVLTVPDLYQLKNGEIAGFIGERAITGAILDVIQAAPPKIYFTRGHGEMQLDDTGAEDGLSSLKQLLRERNFDVENLDLAGGADVPDDAALVVIASPKAAFQPHEVEKLRRYLDQPHGHGTDQHNGRLLVLLEPGEQHGLDDLFYDWGVRADDMLVIEQNPNAQAPDGDMIIGSLAEHPITLFLGQNQIPVRFGLTRPVREDLSSPLDDRREVSELLRTTKDAFAERDYREQHLSYDPATDLPGPVSVAVVSERKLPGALGLPLKGGCLVVFGDADFAGNERLGYVGNSYLLLNTVNYLLDRQKQLNIPARPPFQFQVGLSRENLVGLGWRLALLPITLGALGGLVFLWRRR